MHSYTLRLQDETSKKKRKKIYDTVILFSPPHMFAVGKFTKTHNSAPLCL